MQDSRLLEIINRAIADSVAENHNIQTGGATEDYKLQIGVSNRHVHLSREDLDVLFGPGYSLKIKKALVQPGQFAAEETVTVTGSRGSLKNVRVLGPLRRVSQVEISKTDGFALGVSAPVRESGKVEGTPGILLVGPAGQIEIPRGVMVAWRHIHLDPRRAASMGLKDSQQISVKVDGLRGGTIDHVLVRVSEEYAPEMHIDLDEANALDIKNDDSVTLIV